MSSEDRIRKSEDDATPAQSTKASIRGRVLTRDGKPAPGVLVTIEGNDVADLAQQTGDDGSFLIGNLNAGTYKVHAHGAVTGSASVEVGPTGEHRADIAANEGEPNG